MYDRGKYMNKYFLIAKKMKNFIHSLDNMIVSIPNKDRIIKERIYNTSYDILYYIYLANYGDDKKEYYRKILSLVSMLDFYLERCLKCKYISMKMCENKSHELLTITKMIYGWIKYESK